MCLKLCTKLFVKDIPKHSRNILISHRRNKITLISHKAFGEYANSVPEIVNKISVDKIPYCILENMKNISEISIRRDESIAGPITIFSYEKLEKSQTVTEEKMHQIQTLAWGTEMVNLYFMILKDIEDRGTRTKGKSCWNLYDAALLRSSVYEVLNINFGGRSSHLDFLRLFDKAFQHTAIGYHLDNTRKQNKDYSNFNLQSFNNIANYKTFQYFNLPILLAMNLSNTNDLYSEKKVSSICKDLGNLYQMQKDFLSCYGESPEQPGLPSHSDDIREGRCSWLFASALQRCTPAQRIVLRACYGSLEPAHVERVKLLYDQLQMPNIYKEEEEKICASIVGKAKNLDGNKLSSDLFLKLLDVVKNRDC